MKTLTQTLFVILLTLGFTITNYAQETARLQVIHNSADAAAETVDIWLNDGLLLDDFSFRTASPFIDAPAGEEFTIGVAPASSENADESIATFDYTLEGGEKYILVASGIVSESGYDPAEPFNIYVYDMAREMATDGANTDALVFHGSTDAPTVDILETGIGAGTLVDNASYGDFAGYLELPTDDYQITIADETGKNAVAVFGAPLISLGLNGQALTIVASGFLSPTNNSDGAAFALFVALPSGGELIELTNTTSVEENEFSIKKWSVYPNPANQRVTIEMTEEMESAQLRVMSLTGQVLDVLNIENQRMVNITTDRYAEGIYFINITNGSAVQTKKLQIVK